MTGFDLLWWAVVGICSLMGFLLLSKAVFNAYFEAKEKFVDRLVHKERKSND